MKAINVFGGSSPPSILFRNCHSNPVPVHSGVLFIVDMNIAGHCRTRGEKIDAPDTPLHMYTHDQRTLGKCSCGALPRVVIAPTALSGKMGAMIETAVYNAGTNRLFG